MTAPEPDDEPAVPPLEAFADPAYDVVRRGKQRGGIAGAVVAGFMVAIRDVLDPPKDPQSVVVQAPSDPKDIDADGVNFDLPTDDAAVTVTAPPLPPLPVRPKPAGRSRRSPRRTR